MTCHRCFPPPPPAAWRSLPRFHARTRPPTANLSTAGLSPTASPPPARSVPQTSGTSDASAAQPTYQGLSSAEIVTQSLAGRSRANPALSVPSPAYPPAYPPARPRLRLRLCTPTLLLASLSGKLALAVHGAAALSPFPRPACHTAVNTGHTKLVVHRWAASCQSDRRLTPKPLLLPPPLPPPPLAPTSRAPNAFAGAPENWTYRGAQGGVRNLDLLHVAACRRPDLHVHLGRFLLNPLSNEAVSC